MRVFYTDVFELPLPEGHRFPASKYRLLRERLQQDSRLSGAEFSLADRVTTVDLDRVHTRDYRERFETGLLGFHEQRRIGLPWSQELVERSRRSVGATLAACRAALEDGIGVYLGGGTHHAFPASGGGFCVYNDAPVAIRALQAEGSVRRAVIIDCDVHQGDGTAAILNEDRTVFTLSVHGEKNYPFKKMQSDLDIGLPDGTADGPYVDAVERGVDAALAALDADFAIYLAGADPHENDRLGKLSVTFDGLERRDTLVIEKVRARNVPIAIVMAGGYGRDLSDTVHAHANTVRTAAGYARR